MQQHYYLLTTMASADTSYSPKVQKRTLKGHRQPVLCISHPGDHAKYSSITDAHLQHHPSLLLSGSEDGTARLWDLRTRKAAYCIVAPVIENEPNDVTAVAFHPSIIEDRQRSDESGDATISTSRLDCMV
jgi:WD40 repeat protein